jgi:hypothetical protein
MVKFHVPQTLVETEISFSLLSSLIPTLLSLEDKIGDAKERKDLEELTNLERSIYLRNLVKR